MTKKLFFLILILVIIPISTFCAEEKNKNSGKSFHLGIYSGLGTSGAFYSDGDSIKRTDFSFNPGVRFSYFRTNDFSFMAIADIGYLQVHYITQVGALTYETHQIREFVNINLMAGINYKYLYATGGFFIAPITNAWRWDEVEIVNMTGDYTSDFGLVVEVGAKIPLGDFTFFIGLNVRFGFIDVHSRDATSMTNLWTVYGVIGMTYAIF